MLRIGEDDIDILDWKELNGHLDGEKVVERFPTEEDCEELLFQSIWQLGYS